MNNSPLALMCGAVRWHSAELRIRAAQRADQLAAHELRAGQVVLAPDAPALDLFLLQQALADLGAALLPYRAQSSPAQIQHLITTTGAEWRWFPESNQLIHTGCTTAAVPNSDPPLALLIATSGSSGAPKVVQLTADNLRHSARAVNARLALRAGDCWLCCLRLSHIGGISIGYRTTLAGATLLLHDGFDAAAVARDLRELPVTHLSLVPPMLARLLDFDPTPPPQLRVLLVGGQALSPALARLAINAGWPVFLSYGMTETASQIATGVGEISAACAFNPLPDMEIFAPDCTEPAQRLRVRGAMVMAGYATPQRQHGHGLVNGWFETADLGCVNAAGQLCIHGRADDVRVIGGTNVSLARVETVIQNAPGVSAALIVAEEDRVWGHRLIAVYCGSAPANAVQFWCQQHLTGPEQPRDLVRLCRLPLLTSGKYDRRRLTAIVQRLRRDTAPAQSH